MLAYFIDNFSPFIFEPCPGFGIRWYGFAYVLGFFFGYALLKRLAEKRLCCLAPNQVSDFITGAAIFGVLLGGRLGYVLFYGFGTAMHDPLSIFRVWEGGMASHGGMIGLFLFTLWYARRHELSWLNLGDNLAVVAPVGLFFGRCANFINGELFGRPTNVPWAMQFPKELYDSPALADKALAMCAFLNPPPGSVDQIIEQGRHDTGVQAVLRAVLTPRHPSQIYEALLEGGFLFLVLWLARTRFRLPRGLITGIFFVLYACVRIFSELFREPDAPLTGGLTRGQFLSLFLMVAGIGFAVYAMMKPKYEPCEETDSTPS
jgi:phosphatidylglycerol:prolipoprotein diacylglycerol transferase